MSDQRTPFFLLLSLFLSPFFVSAQSINTTKIGKGIQFIAADSSFSVKLGARIQSLYQFQYNYEDDSFEDEFQIRRARLKLDGFVYSPKLVYKIELALSNSDIGGNVQSENNNTANIVLDAVAKWNFAKNFNLWFGQTKLPGNRERVISSQKLQFVDRSLLNARYNIDRDLGMQLHHEFEVGKLLFREVASISMGEGRNIAVANKGGHDFTGRVEVLPFGEFKGEGDYFASDLEREEKPKLAVGITYDYNSNASRERGQLGAFFSEQRDLKTVFTDAMFKYQGFSLMAEYADKRSSGSPVVETDADGNVTEAFFTGKGYNIQAGYLFKNNIELAGRYTAVTPEASTQREDNTQYTLGISKYLAGHTVKVQSDISLLKEKSENSNLMYRFQVEIGF